TKLCIPSGERTPPVWGARYARIYTHAPGLSPRLAQPILEERDAPKEAPLCESNESVVPVRNSERVGGIELAEFDPVGSRRNDVRADFLSGDAPRIDPVSCRVALRGPCAAPSTAGARTVQTATASPSKSGPMALGVAVTRTAGERPS